MGINRRINICLCFHIALINVQTQAALLQPPDLQFQCSGVRFQFLLGFRYQYRCLPTDFAFARFYLIAVMELRVTPGQTGEYLPALSRCLLN